MPLTKNKGSTYIGANDNLIINGDMSINQRGQTSYSGVGYHVDRFYCNSSQGGLIQRISATPAGSANGVRVTPTAGKSAGIYTSVESYRAGAREPLSFGENFTISFYVKTLSVTSDINLRIQFKDGVNDINPSDIVPSQTIYTTQAADTWEKVTYTFQVLAAPNPTNVCTEILVQGTTDVVLEFTQFKLEKGSQATPFVTASRAGIGGELALCQRYYCVARYNKTYLSANNETNRAICYFPVIMRGQPTITVNDGQDVTVASRVYVDGIEVQWTTGGAGTFTIRSTYDCDAEL